MKSLFVVYYRWDKKTHRAYFRADNLNKLINHLQPNGYIVQIKRLKRIYRKTDIIMEV